MVHSSSEFNENSVTKHECRFIRKFAVELAIKRMVEGPGFREMSEKIVISSGASCPGTQSVVIPRLVYLFAGKLDL